MTALQQEPSAYAPWTRTMFGRALIRASLLARQAGNPSGPGSGAPRAPAPGLNHLIGMPGVRRSHPPSSKPQVN